MLPVSPRVLTHTLLFVVRQVYGKEPDTEGPRMTSTVSEVFSLYFKSISNTGADAVALSIKP